MKKEISLIIVSVFAISFVGCSMVTSPVGNGILFTSIKAPIAVTPNEVSSKKGSSSCTSVLGLVSFGDASIEAARAGEYGKNE